MNYVLCEVLDSSLKWEIVVFVAVSVMAVVKAVAIGLEIWHKVRGGGCVPSDEQMREVLRVFPELAVGLREQNRRIEILEVEFRRQRETYNVLTRDLTASVARIEGILKANMNKQEDLY